MLIMHRSPRISGHAMRILAIVLACLAIAGLLIFFTPRAAAAQSAAVSDSASTPSAQSGARSVVILLLKGEDTLVVERIQRNARLVTATIAGPASPRISLQYALGADHLIPTTAFTVGQVNAAADAPPLQSGSLTLTADSAFLSITGGGTTRDIRVATRPGALPIVNNDFVAIEQAVRRARAQGVTDLTVPLFALSAAQTVDANLVLVGSDSARLSLMNNITTVAIDSAGNVTGGEVAAQGIRIVVLEGDSAAAVGIAKPDYSPPDDATYTAEEVTVRTPAGHVLAGTLTLPAAAGPRPEASGAARAASVPRASQAARHPAVVTITGSGMQDRDEFIPVAGGFRLFRQVADTLTRRGIAVLRLDDRGIGGSGGDVNGTSADFADDIRAAVAYLRNRDDIDPNRIALVGHSEGGMIAPMVAATDSAIAAVALFAGTAYTGRAIIDFQLDNAVRNNPAVPATSKDSIVAAMRAGFDTTAARTPWMRYFLAYDPLPTARRVRQPVLILQGATDQQVRPEEARMLEKALREAGNRDVTLRMFENRNHLFLHDSVGHPSGYATLPSGKVDAEVLGVLADWLAQHLGSR